MSPACRAFLPRWLLVAAIASCLLPGSRPSFADPPPCTLRSDNQTCSWLPYCEPQSDGTINCNFSCTGKPRSTRRKSFVLFISDDDSYCHMGFMQGMCLDTADEGSENDSSLQACPSGDSRDCTEGVNEICVRNVCIKPCVSNLGCGGTTAICTSDEVVAAARTGEPPLPLRLADPTCRNRSAKLERRNPFTEGRGWFQFRRNFPFFGDPDNQRLDPHVVTPHLDRLASSAAVFQRAHAGGMECKASRTVFWNGIFNEHLHDRFKGDSGGTCNPDSSTELSGVGCYLHKISKQCAYGSCSTQPYDVGCTCSAGTQCASGTCSAGKCTANCATAPRTFGCSCTANNGCASNLCPEPYMVYLWGKGDMGPKNGIDIDDGAESGNPPLGNLNEDECTTTEQDDITHGLVHPECITEIHKIFEKIETNTSVAEYQNYVLRKPFLVWYAPNIPHFGGAAPQKFKDLYEAVTGEGDDGWNAPVLSEFSRMTLFDAGVGEFIDALKRRGICDADGNPRSLYEQTVILFINDNGNMMPNGKRRPTENGERSPIIVDEPAFRDGSAKRLMDYASGVDLLKTILSYALETPAASTDPVPSECGDVTTQPHTGYPFSYDLCRTVRGATNGLRKAYPAHEAPINFKHKKRRTLLTAPGQLGVCTSSKVKKTWQGHIRLCRQSADCPCKEGQSCTSGVDDVCDKTTFNRCTNRPDLLCDEDADCAQADFCGANNLCRRPDGAFNAFAGRPCADNEACVAEGVCKLHVCTNLVGKTCDTDAECGENLCQTGICPNGPASAKCCKYPDGAYADFTGRACDGPGKCVPKGVCQKPVLKVMVGPTGPGDDCPCDPIIKVTDPLWDPDEAINLLGEDAPQDYLTDLNPTVTLADDFRNCLRKFWYARENASGVWAAPTSTTLPSGCSACGESTTTCLFDP